LTLNDILSDINNLDCKKISEVFKYKQFIETPYCKKTLTSQPEFSFLAINPEGKLGFIRDFGTCRSYTTDYIRDVYKNHLGFTFEEYNTGAKLTTYIEYSKEAQCWTLPNKTISAIICHKDVNIKRIIQFLRPFEQALKIKKVNYTKHVLLEVPYDGGDGSGINKIHIFIGSKIWMKSLYLLSLYQLLIRAAIHSGDHSLDKMPNTAYSGIKFLYKLYKNNSGISGIKEKNEMIRILPWLYFFLRDQLKLTGVIWDGWKRVNKDYPVNWHNNGIVDLLSNKLTYHPHEAKNINEWKGEIKKPNWDNE